MIPLIRDICRFLTLPFAITLLLTTPPGSTLQAGLVSAVDVQTPGGDSLNLAEVIGWEFSPNVTITVKALGFCDDSTNGLANAHEPTLREIDQTLLRFTVIPEGTRARLVGRFRYVEYSQAARSQCVTANQTA
ncbi:MAG: hypothetical protein NT069_25725 [Planctomycetota bacterium]|nr:hypothetical protein [Planctomycetota bacterium]